MWICVWIFFVLRRGFFYVEEPSLTCVRAIPCAQCAISRTKPTMNLHNPELYVTLLLETSVFTTFISQTCFCTSHSCQKELEASCCDHGETPSFGALTAFFLCPLYDLYLKHEYLQDSSKAVPGSTREKTRTFGAAMTHGTHSWQGQEETSRPVIASLKISSFRCFSPSNPIVYPKIVVIVRGGLAKIYCRRASDKFLLSRAVWFGQFHKQRVGYIPSENKREILLLCFF